MKASEIMTREVIVVRPDTSVAEIARLLVDHRIGGIPVIDASGRLVGIVTEYDIFLKAKGVPFSAVKLPSLFREYVDPDDLAALYADAQRHTAADVMTQHVVCVAEDAEIGEVAWLMTRHHLARVLVTLGDQVTGIITRADIIRAFACRC